ncbi:proline rich 13 [Phyllostomus discolor]|uniref:Proline rich 13 n=1 Tax=Phyllostomus discolor TaxID=89673 RepID=A0A834DGL3_9CHIR|nr:proline rich 13 [Phyllostomus discolor]
MWSPRPSSCATTSISRMPTIRSLPSSIPTTCSWNAYRESIGSWHGRTRNGDGQDAE